MKEMRMGVLRDRMFAMIESSMYSSVGIVTCAMIMGWLRERGKEQKLDFIGANNSISNSNDNSFQNEDSTAIIYFCLLLQLASSVVSFAVVFLYEFNNHMYTEQTNSMGSDGNIDAITKRGEACIQIRNKNSSDGQIQIQGNYRYRYRHVNIHSLGISFGSVVTSLILFVPEVKAILKKGEDAVNVNVNGGDLTLTCGLIYSALLACLGFSFASSAFIASISARYNDYYIKKSKSENISKGADHLIIGKVEEERGKGNIVHGMLPIFLVLLAYMINLIPAMMPIILTYGVVQSLLLLLYCFETSAKEFAVTNDKGGIDCQHRRSVSTLNSTQPPLQHVFTLGEWVVVSSILSLLLVDYAFRYNLANIGWRMIDGGVMSDNSFGTGTNLPSQSQELLFESSSIPSELVVMHSGIVGCIAGVCVSTFIVKAAKAICSYLRSSRSLYKTFLGKDSLPFVDCSSDILITVLSTILSLNYSLEQFCQDNVKNDKGVWCYISSGDDEGMMKKYLVQGQVPISIRWIFHFLTETEFHHFPTISPELSCPRYVWLLYWCLAILILGPVAVAIAQKLKRCKADKKKMLTIVARKYFHFVAVILFAPPTYFAPNMMSLSYAIATCLLIMVERVRATANSSEMEKVGTELCTNLKGRETQLSVQHFFKVFFDEKDSGAALGGFVVTHIALIIGCAAPLWVRNLYHTNGFLRFIGIIALGIGDSAGAIIGSLCGKRRWPRSRRTKEGSLAVFTSMFVAVLCLESYSSACASIGPVLHQTMFVLIPLTALEAVTLQIDNLCLPLFAILLSLVLSAWSL